MSNKTWPAETVEMRDVSALIPYAGNAKKHPKEQVELLARAISEYGWTVPVLVDEKGVVIAGHGRILAAQKLGIEKVPVMTAHGWTEAQKKAYVIADNQIPSLGEWDQGLLAQDLEALKADGSDLTGLGFSDADLSRLVGGDERAGDEKVQTVETSEVADRFWIILRGPLKEQHRALAVLKKAYADLGFVEIEMGTVEK